MSQVPTSFVHHFQPAAAGPVAAAPTLLLLHGTGGDETALLPIGRRFGSGVNLLSPRGRVLKHGMPRFFRRLAEGVFDEEDIRRRTAELSQFVREAAAYYGFNPVGVVALGYSNGANIAASLLLLHPATLAHAVLLHPIVPLLPAIAPDLWGKQVLLTAGRADPIAPVENTERLAGLLHDYGARVEVAWQLADHQLLAQEITAAERFVQRLTAKAYLRTTVPDLD